MMRVESSIYAFAEDMRGEGPVPVIDRILGYGCDGVTVAAAYHRARDVTPHGPARVTLRQDGIHFPPPQELFRRLRPAEAEGPVAGRGTAPGAGGSVSRPAVGSPVPDRAE